MIMDGSAVMNENCGVYQGQDRYECRKNVIADLEKGGYLLQTEPYGHNVGKCYRCKTDIEPYVSKQWFVKVKPLAKTAMAAVIKGKTKIVPPMWEATYFDWLENIRDWCISRQIWWGHRIPVWYCDGCSGTIVSTEDPASCPTCKGTSLRQEEDVLDTWFSSALWPFSTLGWPDQTPALKTFYPTSLLVTGFDILFFWVARMMMMGLYTMKDVPFRDVYLHALVRDEHGDKMSKSKGNIIDPLEMVDKYGADAFRFTLAAFTAQGRDVRMSEERIQGYKFFVNKLWNAARFSLMNLEGLPPGKGLPDRAALSLADRWILSRLNRSTAEVIRALDEYKFNEAAAAVYQFVWHELCDWYLEMGKPVLYSKEAPGAREAAQRTLEYVLKASLQLLHPFMPFVTEEIWQVLVGDGASVMVSRFPEPDPALNDPEAEAQTGLIMDVIGRVRNIRGEMNIPPSRKLKVIVSAAEAEKRTVAERGRSLIVHLANLESLEVTGAMEEPKGAATGVIGAVRVFVLLEGTVDWAGEKARLEKEVIRVQKDLAQTQRKLSSSDFRERAAEVVVQKEEQKRREFSEKLAALEKALTKVRALV
jgi:valyl-tRNA synthetase